MAKDKFEQEVHYDLISRDKCGRCGKGMKDHRMFKGRTGNVLRAECLKPRATFFSSLFRK